MARLARAKGGNTLAMLAIFLIPLSALTGSAVDIGRLYLVKARLQQACDAGVLAGRKFMVDTSLSTLDPVATTQAQTFFANNFPSGLMGTPAFTALNVPFTPTKTADNQVAGTATTTVPMTIMKMFGMPSRTLTVTCEARYDTPDTDVVFVLDTTGSMVCAPWEPTCSLTSVTYTRADGSTGYSYQEKSSSKIVALRSAVMSFFDTVEDNTDASTHVRYGIVPYSSTVNAGAVLKPQYFPTDWHYQTRRVVGDVSNGTDPNTTYTFNVTSATCNGLAGRVPATGSDKYGNTTYPYDASGNAVNRTVRWVPNFFSQTIGTCVVSTQQLAPIWRYQEWPADITGYVASLTTGVGVQDPSKIGRSLNRWQGCIEERQTTASTSFDINNLPPDLDPDLIPSSIDSQWKPMWPEQIYDRGARLTVDDTSDYNNVGAADSVKSGYVSCGKPVQKLAPLTRDQLLAYVNAPDFRAAGGTYHDVGMIWGTRMISPNGIFAADTAAWPGRPAPKRNIVFMTDGDMQVNQTNYGMYGFEQSDKRVSAGNFASLKDRHNARFLAECAAAKARNINVFVIGFAQTLTPELTQCASPGQAFYASDNASLTAAFRKIASQVAMLRISK